MSKESKSPHTEALVEPANSSHSDPQGEVSILFGEFRGDMTEVRVIFDQRHGEMSGITSVCMGRNKICSE